MSKKGALCLSVLCAACGPILGIEETKLEPSTGDCQLLAVRVYFPDKPDADGSITLGMSTEDDLFDFGDALGVDIDEARGHVLTRILDCQNAPIEDAELVLIQSDGDNAGFVLGDSGPVLGTDTSESGYVGILNVAPSSELRLQAIPEALAPSLSSAGDVEVKAGELAMIELAPNSEVDEPASAPEALACVGMIAEPMSTEAEVSLMVTVVRAQSLAPTGEPLAGVRLRVCVENGTGCTTDLDANVDAKLEAITDDAGQATLSLPITGGEGFDGHILAIGALPGCE